MAFAVITFENKKTKQLKLAPIGFSWTNLFLVFLFLCLGVIGNGQQYFLL
jgi:hypothetical protein